MSTPRILMVLTSHNQLGDTSQPTGFWLEEFAGPYYTFVDAGATVTLASIQGGQPPIDPKSYAEDAQTETTRRFLVDTAAKEALANTLAIAKADAGDYDAVFLPGGHGTMWDFPTSPALTNLIEAFDEEEKLIAAVCHAPAALVTVKTASGEPLVKNKVVTAFTDSEERAVELETVVPFMLETRLRELGATFEGDQDWAAHVRQDGNLITGQNPASSEPAARAVLEAIRA
ncbi:MAG: type 1 glutamine amidotransferase domain-containing protein [Cyanobacteria bacterium P01_D01_bin.1]